MWPPPARRLSEILILIMISMKILLKRKELTAEVSDFKSHEKNVHAIPVYEPYNSVHRM